MIMTSARRLQLIESLRDKESRDIYVSEHIRQGVAFQIRAMREARNWTQTQLGQRVGKPQESISKIEDPDYGRFQLRTLMHLASALDVALIVRFAPYSELLDWTINLAPENVTVPDFASDPGLRLTGEIERFSSETSLESFESKGRLEPNHVSEDRVILPFPSRSESVPVREFRYAQAR